MMPGPDLGSLLRLRDEEGLDPAAPYGLPPNAPAEAPAYPAGDIERAIRGYYANAPAPPQAPAPGFLDRLGAGLADMSSPGASGHAGDVFGANLLAGFGRSFGGARMSRRDQEMQSLMAGYERQKAERQAQLEAQLTGIKSDYESHVKRASESAKGLAEWRKNKANFVQVSPEEAKANPELAPYAGRYVSRETYTKTLGEAPKEKRRQSESDRDYNLRLAAERRQADKDKREASGGGKPPTEAQGKDILFAKMGRDALLTAGSQLKVKGKPAGALEDYFANSPAAQWELKAPNVAKSPEAQAYSQAISAFAQAYLRKTSGAAVTEDEWKKVASLFFVQPGDFPQTVEIKRRMRETFLSALEGNSAMLGGGATSAPASVPSTWKQVR